jgi:hypothetical protein
VRIIIDGMGGMMDKSVFVGGMNHVIVVTERIVLFIVCYADKMCSKERWA